MTDHHPRLITRRRSLALLGSTGAGLFLARGGPNEAFARTTEGDDHVADAAGACTLTAEQEEGPFYVAVDRVRSDIALGQAGLPFVIEITVIDSRTCRPLRDAAVDIWHCNASGIYSDITSEDTRGETFLRGVQFTDRHGRVTFQSIFPGHYTGRTTHVHARVHINFTAPDHTLRGGHICHTGQVFPSEAAYAEVYALSPYSAETATGVSHAEDRVWSDQHGYTEAMTMSMIGSRLAKGLIGKVTMAVNPTATPKLIGATSTTATTTGSGSTGGPPSGTSAP